jgi:hypothetical protein
MIYRGADILAEARRFGAPKRADPSAVTDGWLAPTSILMIVALLTRIVTFGDPVLHVDDQFYLLGGHEILRGHILYVDFWDRKPPGIFLIYALFALFPDDVLAYQIGATLFAWVTACTIYFGARRFASALGALLGGCSYLLTITLFGGYGGQTPVFYNLLIAFAALLVMPGRVSRPGGQLRQIAAIGICGLALTIKPTALPEALFISVMARQLPSRLFQPGRPFRNLVIIVIILGLPAIAIAGFYLAIGAFYDLWFATVVSIFYRASLGPVALHAGMLYCAIFLTPIFLIAGRGLWDLKIKDRAIARFVTGWLAASVAGFLLVPTFYLHYSLPLMVPLAVASAAAYSLFPTGPMFFGAIALLAVLNGSTLEWRRFHRDKTQYAQLAKLLASCPRASSLFVQDGPVRLYDDFALRRPGRMIFPDHLGLSVERNAIPVDQASETRQILMARPDVVITATPPGQRATSAVWHELRQSLTLQYRKIGSADLPLDRRYTHHLVFCRNFG